MPANPFNTSAEAARIYAGARPYYHARPLQVAFESIDRPAMVGLDLGCGTGLSTRALAERVATVVAIDPSATMLAERESVSNAIYVQGSAECLPLTDDAVDVVTCGAAMHWFRDRAFDELGRVTKRGGSVVVYSDFFLGDLIGEPTFVAWWKQTYLPRLPTPPRREHFNQQGMARAGFSQTSYEQQMFDMPMSRTDLVSYLLTQSNVTLAVDSGDETLEGLREWISNQFDAASIASAVTARFAFRVWTAARRTV